MTYNSSSNKHSSNNNNKVRKSQVSLSDKDQKAKARILRNRAAAQESRDKKRRYVADLEESNQQLAQENKTIHERMHWLEAQNAFLQAQLAALLGSKNSSLTFSTDGFCDSARIAKRISVIIWP
jgi:predicted XRE-type DNA-binding protein